MTSTELRIGNYINAGGVLRKVISIDLDGCISEPLDDKEMDYSKGIEPIPLTEEWLLKFGFENDIFKASGIIVNRYKIKGICLSIDTRKESEYKYLFFKEDKFIKTVKFIHELQNLYFALTGEELVCK